MYSYKNDQKLNLWELKDVLIKVNVDKENPSVFQMVVWMIDANKGADIEALNFEDFM